MYTTCFIVLVFCSLSCLSQKNCISNGDCSSSEYCRLVNCGGTNGSCVAKPEICSDIASQVCGCDGKNYSNNCYAERSGVSVKSVGACSTSNSGSGSDGSNPPSSGPGSSDDSNSDSGSDDVNQNICLLPKSTKSCSDGSKYYFDTTTNQCTQLPAGECSKNRNSFDYLEQCRNKCGCKAPDRWVFCFIQGCQQKRCPNHPDAKCVNSTCGGCKAVFYKNNEKVTDCGCKRDLDCEYGQYCNKPNCADIGTCTAKTTTCTNDRSPVCSCTGKTHANSCIAAKNGESVKATGECPPKAPKRRYVF